MKSRYPRTISTRYAWHSAIWAIVANMIGTGIFTSLGYQLVAFNDYFVIISLWFVGGIIALCGAYAYSRLAVAMPDAIGEYDYLSRLVHPAAGFVSSWISVTVGFAAPIALILKTMEVYLQSYANSIGIGATPIVLGILVVATVAHSISYNASGHFHAAATAVKIVMLVVFVVVGLLSPGQPGISFAPSSHSFSYMTTGAFATALVYVLYTYSGWNASTYLARELPNPARTLPKSIFIGTVGVSVLYMLINAMFLYTTPADLLRVDSSAPKDLAVIVATHILPSSFANSIGIVIVILLTSSMSAMIMVGPRVSVAIGEANTSLRYLAARTRNGIPTRAILLQSLVSIALYVTNAFEQILMFTTMIITVSTLVTVWSSLKVSRGRITWLSVFIFSLSNLYVLYHVGSSNPLSIVWTLVIIGMGLVIHRLV